MRSLIENDVPAAFGGLNITLEERLLCLCARPALSASQYQLLLDMLQASPNWDAIIAGAARGLSANLTLRHIVKAGRDVMPAPHRLILNHLSQDCTRRQIEIVRTQRTIFDEEINPRRVRHAFIKGALLSARYYGGALLRQYRDIDVLLTLDEVIRIGTSLVRKGYEITNAAWKTMVRPDIGALCEYSAALELRSPSGVGLELHRRLDNSGCVFDPALALTMTTRSPELGFEAATLEFPLYYLYLIFHHSRHRWQSIHWIGDLFALESDRYRYAKELETLAADLGLTSTLIESDCLRDNMGSIATRGNLGGMGESALFADCLAGVRSCTGSQSESSEGFEDRPVDFAYRWQESRGYRMRMMLYRLKPTIVDFNHIPLPSSLRSAYYLLRPLRVFGGYLVSAFSR